VPNVFTYWASRTHCTVTERCEAWLNDVSQGTKLAGAVGVKVKENAHNFVRMEMGNWI